MTQENCQRCGKPGGWVEMKYLPGRFHVRCAFEAEYIRDMAERGHMISEIPDSIQRKFKKLTAKVKRLKPPEGVVGEMGE